MEPLVPSGLDKVLVQPQPDFYESNPSLFPARWSDRSAPWWEHAPWAAKLSEAAEVRVSASAGLCERSHSCLHLRIPGARSSAEGEGPHPRMVFDSKRALQPPEDTRPPLRVLLSPQSPQ